MRADLAAGRLGDKAQQKGAKRRVRALGEQEHGATLWV